MPPYEFLCPVIWQKKEGKIRIWGKIKIIGIYFRHLF
jgi:hypothetical protein